RRGGGGQRRPARRRTGGKRADGTAAHGLRPGGGLSRSQGEPELPGAPAVARITGGCDPERAALLQRGGARLQHEDPVGARHAHRAPVRLHRTRVLRAGRSRRDPGTEGPLLNCVSIVSERLTRGAAVLAVAAALAFAGPAAASAQEDRGAYAIRSFDT